MNTPPDPHDLASAVKRALQHAANQVHPSTVSSPVVLAAGLIGQAQITDELGHGYTHDVTVRVLIDVRAR
jgi:hypothetical protein